MNRLWAPWRYDYVTGPESRGCLFCRLWKEPAEKDRHNLVLHRGDSCFAVLNRYPYINGHLMIVPVRHVPDITSCSPGERLEMMDLAAQTESALREVLHCQGMNGGWNLGVPAGAGIPGHLHFHVLPRWSGDTNFLTAVGGVRVISQSLEQTWDALVPFFREIR